MREQLKNTITHILRVEDVSVSIVGAVKNTITHFLRVEYVSIDEQLKTRLRTV